MRRVPRGLIAIAIAVVLSLGFSRAALAKPMVDVVAIELAPGATTSKDRDKRLKTMVRRLAYHAAKHLDFGKSRRVEVSFLVKELKIEEQDGLLRVTCTLVGKLKGGGSAKSRLSFGGKPGKRKQIEREVMASVTDGVITRLAEMARARP